MKSENLYQSQLSWSVVPGQRGNMRQKPNGYKSRRMSVVKLAKITMDLSFLKNEFNIKSTGATFS